MAVEGCGGLTVHAANPVFKSPAQVLACASYVCQRSTGDGQPSLMAGLQVVMQSSEIGDERPVAACAFAPDGAMLATASWSGRVKLWRTHGSEKLFTMQAHDTRITGASTSMLACLPACRSGCCSLLMSSVLRHWLRSQR
jgi:WD40 repeat protein